ncbi:MAG: alpha/beta hydrolase [Cytophagales bacterium]|nr:alpha/beta hydrolase [Cytophagales bacterium]
MTKDLLKLKFILPIIIISMNGCANSETAIGYWTGIIEMNGKEVDLTLDLDSERQIFSSSDLMLIEQPISDLKMNNSTISFSLILDVELHFNGVLKNDQIQGSIEMQNAPPNMNMAFRLRKQVHTLEKPYSVEDLTIKSKDVILSANYYKQKAKGNFPALVLLHGSSTNLRSDYVYDADFFAKLGFEVLIFDKRGNGKSTGNYSTSNYGDIIEDAIACLEFMSNKESVDKNKIGLWGYSQGAMLLPRIASKTDIPKFLIAKSPEVVSVTEAAAYSDSLRVVNSGGSVSNGQYVANSHREVEKMINNGANYKEVERFIQNRAQQNSFMNQTGLHDRISINENEFNGYYWKGRTENFYSYWNNLDIPTIVLFGERDSFVNAGRNTSHLKSLDNDNIDIILFPKANHSLKKAFDPTTDTEFDFPRLIEGYTENIEKWIEKEITKR